MRAIETTKISEKYSRLRDHLIIVSLDGPDYNVIKFKS